MDLRLTRGNATGFTLIEVMVVVVILSVLAAMIVPRIMSRPGEARLVKAEHDIRAIEAALGLYRLDNFRYPSTEQGLAALVEKPTLEPVPHNWHHGGYLKTVPKDPWGREYLYRNPEDTLEIELISYGADGKPGGEGEQADIVNLELE